MREWAPEPAADKHDGGTTACNLRSEFLHFSRLEGRKFGDREYEEGYKCLTEGQCKEDNNAMHEISDSSFFSPSDCDN